MFEYENIPGGASPVTANGPGGWSFSLAGAPSGSHLPSLSGAVLASGKSVLLGDMPETNGDSQIGSLPHCVT